MTFLVAAIVVTIAVVAFTLFIRPSDLPEMPAPSPTQHLEDRKAAIYENLRDLNFEYRLGKLSDADYQKTKAGLQQELAGVLAEIDQVAKAAGVTPPAAQKAAPAPAPVANKCPSCGAVFPTALRFCGECGKPMAGGEQ